MKTTLDIAEDVLAAVQELSRREGKSAGQVLSELARRALQQDCGTPASGAAAEPEALLGFRPFPSRGGVVTNELIDRLREEWGD